MDGSRNTIIRMSTAVVIIIKLLYTASKTTACKLYIGELFIFHLSALHNIELFRFFKLKKKYNNTAESKIHLKDLLVHF